MNLDPGFYIMMLLLVPTVIAFCVLMKIETGDYNTELNIIESKIDLLESTCKSTEKDLGDSKEMLRVLLKESGMIDTMPKKCVCCKHQRYDCVDGLAVNYYKFYEMHHRMPKWEVGCPYYKDWYPAKCKKFEVKE